MSASGLFRVLRAAMFAAVCVVLAVIGHVLMSGSPVSWWVLLASVTGVGALFHSYALTSPSDAPFRGLGSTKDAKGGSGGRSSRDSSEARKLVEARKAARMRRGG
ncbi:hypothetical protein ACFCYB_30360 [Streptomyces sp. NPDC056309]|uniref:hypothetical protein n=1 Tax=unclassified Streptomyces TaxID=2593676 RepID=UPI0035E2B213